MRIGLLYISNLLLFCAFVSCDSKSISQDAIEPTEINHATITKELIVSQNDDELEQEDYCNWVRKAQNELVKNKEMGDITFSTFYKPADFIACNENKQGLNQSKLNQTKKELGDLMYYDIRISLNEADYDILNHKITSQAEYSKRINYLSFEMQKDIILINGNDTVPCALYHYEKAYDIVNYLTVTVAFDTPLYNCDKTIIISDKLFNTGLIKINYTADIFKNIPKLKVPEL